MAKTRQIEVAYYEVNKPLVRKTKHIESNMQRNIKSQLKKMVENLTYVDVVILDYKFVN